MSPRYGHLHQERRRLLVPVVSTGTVHCSRCGRLIEPGQLWDLDHDDDQPGTYRGPAHSRCNRAHGAAKGNRQRGEERRRRRTDRGAEQATVALALHVEPKCSRISVGVAYRIPGHPYLVELAARRSTWEKALATTAQLACDLPTTGLILVDALLLATPEVAVPPGLDLRRVTAVQVEPATAALVTALHRGELRHVADDRLTSAARGGPGDDTSPLRAVALALWSLRGHSVSHQ